MPEKVRHIQYATMAAVLDRELRVAMRVFEAIGQATELGKLMSLMVAAYTLLWQGGRFILRDLAGTQEWVVVRP